jgi:hypothetical protein
MNRPVLAAVFAVCIGAGVGTGAAAHPLAAQSLTQSLDPYTIVPGTSVACVPGVAFDHAWWRLFDLDAEFGLVDQFCVEDVDYAIESAIGPIQNLTANVYCLKDGLPFKTNTLTLVGTNSIPQPDAQYEFFNIEVGGCCDSATRSMAVALASDDCQETGTCIQLFPGMNDLGQTAPTYMSSPDCGIVDPIDLAAIAFPNAHLIMVVDNVR